MTNSAPVYFYYAFYASGAGAIVMGIHWWRQYLRYRRFPSTNGILLSTELAVGGDGFMANASFRYEVDSQVYTSNRLCSLGDLMFGGASSDPAKRAIANLKVGAPVRVFYDPRNPGFAFLRNGPFIQLYLPILLGMFLAAFGLLFHLKS